MTHECPVCHARTCIPESQHSACYRALVMRAEDTPFVRAYVECALWASTDESTESGGYPMDQNYALEDIAPETLARMVDDCVAFQRDHAADLDALVPYDVGQGGHDFWLTRNRHGAGFWDGDWPEDVGKRLTDAAHAYGEFTLYVDDDGKVHGS